jgi:hypothetical protein
MRASLVCVNLFAKPVLIGMRANNASVHLIENPC